jgi:hypothetical protein
MKKALAILCTGMMLLLSLCGCQSKQSFAFPKLQWGDTIEQVESVYGTLQQNPEKETLYTTEATVFGEAATVTFQFTALDGELYLSCVSAAYPADTDPDALLAQIQKEVSFDPALSADSGATYLQWSDERFAGLDESEQEQLLDFAASYGEENTADTPRMRGDAFFVETNGDIRQYTFLGYLSMLEHLSA